jgi:hypothetical protein
MAQPPKSLAPCFQLLVLQNGCCFSRGSIAVLGFALLRLYIAPIRAVTNESPTTSLQRQSSAVHRWRVEEEGQAATCKIRSGYNLRGSECRDNHVQDQGGKRGRTKETAPGGGAHPLLTLLYYQRVLNQGLNVQLANAPESKMTSKKRKRLDKYIVRGQCP